MKFLVDNMLGRLAKWLRLFGYDAVYYLQNSDEQNIKIAMRETRILLTRDRRIKHQAPLRLVQMQSESVMEQIHQLVKEIGLEVNLSKMMIRCSLCNTLLEKISKDEIKDRVPPGAYRVYEEFFICPTCDQIYWEGSHAERMIQQLKDAKLL